MRNTIYKARAKTDISINVDFLINQPLKLYKITFLLKMLEVFRLQHLKDFEYTVLGKFTKKF